MDVHLPLDQKKYLNNGCNSMYCWYYIHPQNLQPSASGKKKIVLSFRFRRYHSTHLRHRLWYQDHMTSKCNLVLSLVYRMRWKEKKRKIFFSGQQSCLTAVVQTTAIGPGGLVVRWSVWPGTTFHRATSWYVIIFFYSYFKGNNPSTFLFKKCKL